MMTPDLPFWTRLFLRLAAEAACVVGAAWLLDRLLRPVFWRRALWQCAVISLLLLTASELSGFGRGLASFLFGHSRPEQRIVVWTGPVEGGPSPFPPPTASPPPPPITVHSTAVQPEIARPVWWPGLLWLAGGLAVLGRVAAAQILFISLRRRRPDFSNSDLNGRVATILQRLAVRRNIRLLQSPGLTGPIAFGILRPTIALPVDFAAKFSRAEQDAMLAHELAHLASRDPLWYLLADLGSAALWWLPQAWWARQRLHRASELAADEAAAIFPEGPATLAECLVALGKQMVQFPAASRMGVEGGFRSNLAERVQRLLRLADTARQPSYSWRAHAARLGAILAISAAAIGVSGCLQSRNAVKQPTLQANLSQAWNASPATAVWHSALPPKKPEPLPAPKPVMFQPATQAEPPVVEASPPASPPVTNLVRAGEGRKTIIRKLQTIKFSQLPDGFEQGLPLREALRVLQTLSASNDVDHTGIRFMFNPRLDGTATGEPVDLSAITIKITPPLKNVTLVELLDAICQLADRPISYSVEDYAVCFFAKPPEAALETRIFHVDPNTFVQRMKEVVPQTALDQEQERAREAERNSRGGGGQGYIIDPFLVTRYFGSLGLNLTNNGGFAFFNERTGDILVRATVRDLETAEQAIELLNKVPPQVQIDVKFVTLTQANTNGVFFQYLGKSPMSNGVNGAQPGTAPSFTGTNRFANPSGIFPGAGPAGSNPGQIAPAASDGSLTGAALRTVVPNAPISASPATLGTMTGILTDPQFRVALQAMEQKEGANILSGPRITTESGRQAHLSVTDLVDINTGVPTTGVRAGSNALAAGDVTNTIEEGQALDVIPTVSADGYTIHLVLNASMKEFLGYDKPAPIVPQSNGVSLLQTGVPTNAAPPRPRFRNFSEITAVNVWDGQTVILGGPMQESDASQTQSTNSQREDVMVFITATIIDPAGNRVHTEEEMPFAKVAIPPQEATPPQPQGTNAPK